MKLNSRLAQSIVDNVMKQIPYNVNIMDEKGYIIASGNPARINTLHVGAVAAIKQGKTLPMDQVHGSHGQPGVNMPITYEQQTIGVVGITGDPAKVVPLAALLKTTVELLLKQEEIDQQQRESEKDRQRVLYHLLQATRVREASPSLVLEAQQLNINLTVPWTAVALRCQPEKIDELNNAASNLTFPLANNLGLIIVQDPLILSQLVKRLVAKSVTFAVGETTKLIGMSAKQAVTTLKIRESLQNNNLINFQQVRFIDYLLQAKLPLAPLVEQFNKLAKSDAGKELIVTIREFINCDLNVNQTAKHLYTHRNTINYRLSRIKKITHCDPKKVTDAFQLFAAYLYYAHQQQNDDPFTGD
ncbi:CdaR family transcriptional regulator [Limosilactobacillus caccae]|uniref:CdaR family transcriptional regulator n=1 Tax=Limosilactobacillus caccae TaxID=1926284 RepID=UPI000970FA85|nr:sugar diacid recognition domain-containing protein [Limosilactobacillus caccae]